MESRRVWVLEAAAVAAGGRIGRTSEGMLVVVAGWEGGGGGMYYKFPTIVYRCSSGSGL
jgi:hypothetical protein